MTVQEIDFKFLIEITEYNKEEIKNFVDDVLILKEGVIESINEAFIINDFKSIMEGAHKLKSAIKIFGSQNLESTLESFEIASGENDRARTSEKLEELNLKIPVWVCELEMEFQKLRNI